MFQRNWGATTKTFFLDMGRRVPAGQGRLEMYHEVTGEMFSAEKYFIIFQDPNKLRHLVRNSIKKSKNEDSDQNPSNDAKPLSRPNSNRYSDLEYYLKYSISPLFDIYRSHGESVNHDKDDDEDIGYFQDDDYVDDQGYFHGGGSESSKMSNSKFNKNLKLKMSKNDSIDSFKSARGSLI